MTRLIARDSHIPLAKARAAYRVRIAIITATVLGSLAVLSIIVLLALRYQRRRWRKIQASLPTVVLTSPSSPHVWVVPPIPLIEPDPLHLVPPKSSPDGASAAEEPVTPPRAA